VAQGEMHVTGHMRHAQTAILSPDYKFGGTREAHLQIMAIAPYHFNINELWTLGIAAYAAVVSTFVLGWDAYKWLASGARVEMTASTGMKQLGGVVPDQKTYISITAYNVGDQPTTITNLGGMHFETWWRAFISRRKPSLAFVVNQPSQAQRIPYRFDVGDQWIGLVEQTDELVEKARNGYLFLILYTARGGRGHRVRIRVREKVERK
jgi:hypothetical protein